MDFEIAIKIAGAIAASLIAAAAIGKFVYEISIGHVSHRRESYKFAKDFLEFEQQSNNIHPYVLEKGYQAIAGKTRMNMAETKYLISLKNGDRALRDYILGRQYLEHRPDAGNLQITFKENYTTRWSRKWGAKLYIASYFISCIAAFSPLIFNVILFKNARDAFSVFGLCIIFLLPIAYFSIKAWSRIYRAEVLVKDQEQYSLNTAINTRKASRKRA